MVAGATTIKLCLSLFLSVSSWAVPVVTLPNVPSNVSKATFLKPTVLKEMGFEAETVNVAPHLKFINEQTGKWEAECSSVVVSDDGVIATAGHCVEECVSRGGAYEFVDHQVVVKKEKLPQVSCLVEVNGRASAYHVVATNDCAGDGAQNPENPRGRCNGLDYAFIRLDSPNVLLNRCAAIGSGIVGERVFLIGSGEPTFRDAREDFPPNSNGSLAVSTGEIIPAQSFCMLKDMDGKPISTKIPFSSIFTSVILQKDVTAGRLFQSTVDTVNGFSGSGLFDRETGFLLGINSQADTENNYVAECVGASFSVNIQSVIENLRENYDSSVIKSLFRCETNLIRR